VNRFPGSKITATSAIHMIFRPSHRKKRLSRLAFIAGLAGLAACAKDSPTSPGTHLAFGEWGGDRVQVVASDSSTDVWNGCTGGTFAGNIALEGSGYFSVNGRWEPYFGPFNQPTMPAQMSGQVSGNTMTFSVAVYDTIQKKIISVAPATATLGQHANIVLCP
jgi:hypothetical protein